MGGFSRLLNEEYGFKFVVFDYFHVVDWSGGAVFGGYVYDVVESFVDSLADSVLEFSLLRVRDSYTLRRLLRVIGGSGVAEVVDIKPLNNGYPRLFSVVLKSPISNSTRYRARLLGGIEVMDHIEEGVEEWGFIFPQETDTQTLIKNLETRGRIIRVRERRIDATEAVEKAMKRGIETILTKAEERTIKKANKLGYFDQPKRVSIRQIAKELGLSPSTVDNQLRNGIRKLLRILLTSDDADI